MRFRLLRDRNDGIRVIEEIPDLDLCQIEGRNGIGKSVSARLLELATGGHPYKALPQAWKTLKDLGPTTVLVDGLPGGDALELRLTPDAWPDDPAAEVGGLLGSAFLNGLPVGWDQVQARLKVVRIAGDETLVETIGRTLHEYGAQASSALRQTTPLVARWDADLRDLRSLCAIEPAELRRRDAEARAARAESEEAARTAARVGAEHDRLQRVLDVLGGAVERAERLPDATARVAAGHADQLAARSNAAALQRRASAAAEARGRGKDTADAVARWERLLVLRSRQRNRATVAERQAWAGLGWAVRPHRSKINARRSELRAEVAALEEKIAETDVAATVRVLAGRLEEPLAAAPQAALRAVVAATPRGPLTGAQLARGLRTRREQLAGQPRPGQVDELHAALRRARHLLGMSDRLPGLIAASERKQELVEEAERELRALYDSDGTPASDELELLDAQERARDRLVAAGIALSQANTEAAFLLGLTDSEGKDEISHGAQDDLDGDLDGTQGEDDGQDEDEDEDENPDDPTATARGGLPLLDPDEIRRLWAEADNAAAAALEAAGAAPYARMLEPGGDTAALRAATAETASAAQEALALAETAAVGAVRADQASRAAADDLAALRRTLEASARALRDDDRWAGWRPSARTAFERCGIKPVEAAAALAALDPDVDALASVELAAARAVWHLAETAGALAEGAARVRDGLGAIAGHLAERAREFAPRAALPAQGRFVSDLRVPQALLPWINAEISGLLSTPELLAELFEGADRVRLDVDRLSVSWQGADNRPRRRPLEAFSSGEQVFAYTRAKLGQHGHLKAEHESVVFVLDEFGAFVARDRFGQLLKFVRDSALGTTADQVVFLLPLATDYLADPSAVAQADADEDPAPGSIADRVRQLRQREYYAIPGGVGP